MAVGANAGTASIKILPDTSELVPMLRRDLRQAERTPAMRKGVQVPITPDTDRFGPLLKREVRRATPRRGVEVPVTPDTRNFGRRLHAGVMPGVKSLVGSIGAVFAAVAVVDFFKDSIAEAREAAKVGRQTAAVIKATGGVARVSAKDVDRLADRLSVMVGVDDEVIAAGQNMLLTFKGVRDETGKNNDIFTQATQVAVDMTAALHQGEVSQQGLEKANIMLGKALNDPIKGITSLTRVGVTFTEQQKEQIRTLVEGGDTLGAQRIILEELTSEYAGAAAAAADPWARLSVLWGNVKEQLGTQLLPTLEDVADWLTVKIPQAIEITKQGLRTLRTWWDNNKASVEVLADILTNVFVPATEDTDSQVRTLADNLKTFSAVLTNVAIFTLELVKGWLMLEHVTIGLISVFGSTVSAAGNVVNVIDKLSGGTGHAGDQFVKFGRIIKDQARAEFQAVKTDAQKAQDAIDRLHGKDIRITGTTSLQFTKTFSQADWTNARLAAGRMAEGGIVTTGTGPTADDVPALLSRGETVVPARATRDRGFQRWAAAKGIPGFAGGGLVGGITGTGQAHTGTGKIMDRWGTLILASGVRELLSGGKGIRGALAWARTQVGKPYLWGGVGPMGYDCSGFMSAITNVIQGRNPYSRLFATGSFPAGGWVPGYSPIGFNIGSRRGSPGHMAGTLGGVNVESSGSVGVHMGAGARGARDSLFGGNIWHLAGRSGHPGGDERWMGFDQGGWLQPGATMALNNTGRPEPVGFDYDALADAIAAHPPQVFLDRVRVSHELRSGEAWNTYRR